MFSHDAISRQIFVLSHFQVLKSAVQRQLILYFVVIVNLNINLIYIDLKIVDTNIGNIDQLVGHLTYRAGFDPQHYINQLWWYTPINPSMQEVKEGLINVPGHP